MFIYIYSFTRVVVTVGVHYEVASFLRFHRSRNFQDVKFLG